MAKLFGCDGKIVSLSIKPHFGRFDLNHKGMEERSDCTVMLPWCFAIGVKLCQCLPGGLEYERRECHVGRRKNIAHAAGIPGS